MSTKNILEDNDAIWIGNYGRYDEGALVGAWLVLPFDPLSLNDFLKQHCGIDALHEEVGIFDTNFEGPLGEIGIHVGETCSIEEVNLLAQVLQSDEAQNIPPEVICMVADSSGACSPLDFANIALQSENIPYGVLLQGNWSNQNERLGYTLIDDIYGGIEETNNDTLKCYFDFEAYGRDLILSGDYTLNEDGAILNFDDFEKNGYDSDDLIGGMDPVSAQDVLAAQRYLKDECSDLIGDALEKNDPSKTPEVIVAVAKLFEGLRADNREVVEQYVKDNPINDDLIALANVALQAEEGTISLTPLDLSHARNFDDALGHYIADKFELSNLGRGELETYFDYERYGRDCAFNLQMKGDYYVDDVNANDVDLKCYDLDEMREFAADLAESKHAPDSLAPSDMARSATAAVKVNDSSDESFIAQRRKAL